VNALLISGSEVRALHGSPDLILNYQTLAGSLLKGRPLLIWVWCASSVPNYPDSAFSKSLAASCCIDGILDNHFSAELTVESSYVVTLMVQFLLPDGPICRVQVTHRLLARVNVYPDIMSSRMPPFAITHPGV